jgi:hypothetical protein
MSVNSINHKDQRSLHWVSHYLSINQIWNYGVLVMKKLGGHSSIYHKSWSFASVLTNDQKASLWLLPMMKTHYIKRQKSHAEMSWLENSSLPGHLPTFLSWPILRFSSLYLNRTVSVHTHLPWAFRCLRPLTCLHLDNFLGCISSVSFTTPQVPCAFSLSWSSLCVTSFFPVVWPLQDRVLLQFFWTLYGSSYVT